jgi:hypothetical protein
MNQADEQLTRDATDETQAFLRGNRHDCFGRGAQLSRAATVATFAVP